MTLDQVTALERRRIGPQLTTVLPDAPDRCVYVKDDVGEWWSIDTIGRTGRLNIVVPAKLFMLRSPS